MRVEIDPDDFETAKKAGIGYRIIKEKKEKKKELYKKLALAHLHAREIKVSRVPLHIQRQQQGLLTRETILGGKQEEEGFNTKRRIFKLKSDFV
jgi:hypothetical protein